MSDPHPIAGLWLGGPPAPGEAPPKLAPRLPPGDLIMYQRQADRQWVHAIQDCFADAEAAAHVASAVPAHRRELTARFARLRERDMTLLALATPAQLAIGWGDHWTCTTQDGLTCWGRVEPLGEMMTAEIAASVRLGVPHADIETEMQARVEAIKENYARGWRSGRGWSVVEPDGEVGYVHVAILTPCTPAEFAAARARRWQP